VDESEPAREDFSLLDGDADNVFPELRTLYLSNHSGMPLRIPPLWLPKIQNLYFTGTYYPAEQIVPIIDGASHCLESLGWKPFRSQTSYVESRSFPRLRSLTLGGDEIAPGAGKWEAPLLQRLEIQASRAVADMFLQHANFPSITSLTLAQSSYSPSILHRFFYRHRNLQTIHMLGTAGLGAFLSLVASNRGSNCAFPKVQKLQLDLTLAYVSLESLCNSLSSLLKAMTTRSSTSDTSIEPTQNMPFDLVITSPRSIVPTELSLLALEYPSNVFFHHRVGLPIG